MNRLMELFRTWHWMRWLRMGMGSIGLWMAADEQAPVIGVFGALLIAQAVLNLGCERGACTPSARQAPAAGPEEVIYEEVR
ncbi:MAG: hypothetical protein NW241_16255 [Bacteroidia bacterium]|nr:hypothetical protein [Bacteroidia bacterium]